jgi:protein gp37
MKNSKIEWTDHTFNPWWGCTKVSPACENCYAETLAKRLGKNVWGAKAPRRVLSEHHWKEPIKWNAQAAELGIRARVFCASMADVFEDRSVVNGPRERLWNLMAATPHLDWLLLTKRPENIEAMTPWIDVWPQNVWLGTTVETQKYADERLPHLLKHPSAVRFVSCEPLLGPLDLRPWFRRLGLDPLDWVIAGGESGHRPRPMHPDWVISVRDQCVKAGVPFFFKQWGNWTPAPATATPPSSKLILINTPVGPSLPMLRVKNKNSRILEGRTWDELPNLAINYPHPVSEVSSNV